MSKKHILAITILLLISNSAFGKEYKWVLSSTTESGSKIFYDTNNISKYENKIKFWMLKDYSKPRKDGQSEYTYWSDMGSIVLDCNENNFEVKQFFLYSGKMGSGNIVYNSPYDNKNFLSIPPESAMDIVKEKLCNTK